MTIENNVPVELTNAIDAADAVDNSHRGHHQALVVFVVYLSTLPIDDAISVLNLYVDNRRTKSPKSLCTRSTIVWLTTHFGFRITEDGIVKRGKNFDQKGLTAKALDAAKAKPWYDIANDMAFKVPSGINLTGAAVVEARLEITGKAPITKDELWAQFKADLVKARNSEKQQAWKSEYEDKLASGEVKAPIYLVA